MSSLSKRCEDIFEEIENKITDKEQREFVLNRVRELSYIYMELMDRITEIDTKRIDELEKRQEKLLATMSKLKDSVDLIKSDIYEEEGYDFEVVCPYCGYEFVADVESELREEIECPECHNVIELDWNDEEEVCQGHCNHEHCDFCEKEDVEEDETDSNEDM